MIPIMQEIGHFAPVLPMAVCLLLMLRKREPSPDAVLITCAFFISFIADQMGAFMAEQGMTNRWLFYVYGPIQFGLLAHVLAPSGLKRRAVGIVLLMAVISAVSGVSDAETLVSIAAGLMITMLVATVPLGRFKAPIVVYCAGAIPFLLMMEASPPATHGPWIVGWFGYQAVRVVALLWLSYALMRQPGLEVSDGLGNGEAAAGDWRPFDAGSGTDRRIGPTEETLWV